MEQQNYCIAITSACNWDCGYCCVDTHNRPEPSLELVLQRIEGIAPGSHVSLTGGEPGMVSEERMETILAALEAKGCQIGVNTNGMFFQKHAKQMSRIYDYVYHCSFDLRNKVWLPENHESLNTSYIIVVTNETYPRLESFLTRNSDIDIVIFSADKFTVHGKPGEFLDHKHRIKLYQEYKHLLNNDRVEYLFSKNTEIGNRNKLTRL